MLSLGNLEKAKVVASKSKWILAYYFIYGTLGLYFVIGSIVVAVQHIKQFSAIYIAFIVMFIIGVTFCYIAFLGFSTFPKTPQDPIRIDDDYLYIYSKNRWNIIPRTMIEKVCSLNFTVGGGDGSDGSIIVKTKSDKFKVRHIHNTTEVKAKIKP